MKVSGAVPLGDLNNFIKIPHRLEHVFPFERVISHKLPWRSSTY